MKTWNQIKAEAGITIRKPLTVPDPAPLAERLADVAHENGIVHAALTSARNQGLDDRETLIWIVGLLADHNNAMREELTSMEMRRVSALLIGASDHE